MELLQLRYFYESAVTQSFAKTAKKYNVPPTSVSASVKRLEKELGCNLFDRSSNKIFLNENGRTFLASVSTIFDELDSAAEKLNSAYMQNYEIKMLVRAMRTEITDYIIEYKTKYPKAIFKTVFDFFETDFDKYDIIIDEKIDRYKNYQSFTLFDTKIRLSVADNNPLARKKLTLKMLKNEPFVSIGEENSMHKILMASCKKAGFTPNIVIQSNDVNCNRKLVRANVGIGLRREYPTCVQPKDVVILNVCDFNEHQSICCYYSDNRNIKHFLDFLKKKTLERR